MSLDDVRGSNGLVERVLQADPRIRSCFVRDGATLVVSGGLRQGLTPLMPEHKFLTLVERRLVLHEGIEEGVTKYLGKLDLIVLQHDRLLVIFVPFRFGDVMMSAEPDFPLGEIGKIMAVIDTSYSMLTPSLAPARRRATA